MSVWRSAKLLEATEQGDIQEIAEVLGNVREEYDSKAPWDTMEPFDQLETLYIREYAAENGYDGIAESAEDLLISNNSKSFLKHYAQLFGGIAGLPVGYEHYTEQVEEPLRSSLEENGHEIMSQGMASGADNIAASVLLGIASAYTIGETYYALRTDGIPIDIDGTVVFNDDYSSKMREDLCRKYGIDTYSNDPHVPIRYDD